MRIPFRLSGAGDGVSIIDRLIVLVFYTAALLLPVLFLDGQLSKFSLPKALLFYSLALCLLVLTAVRVIRVGHLVRPQALVQRVYFLLVLVLTVSGLAGIHPYTSTVGPLLRYDGGLIMYYALAIYLLAAVQVADRTWLKRVWWLLLIGFSANVVYGLMQYIEIEPLFFNRHSAYRINGFFGEPTVFAIFLIGMIGLPLTAMIDQRLARWARLGLAGLAALGLLVIFLTYSRGALVAVGLILLGCTYACWRGRKQLGWRGFYPVIFFLVLSLTGAAIAWTTYRVDVNTIYDLQERNETITNRYDMWQAALLSWRDYPLLGSGVETYAYTFGPLRPVRVNETIAWAGYPDRAHNEYLNLLSTTGLLGLATYLVFVFLLFRYYARRLRQGESDAAFPLLSLLGISLVITFSFHFLLSWFLFILLTIGVRREGDSGGEKHSWRVSRPFGLAFGVTALACLLAGSWQLSNWLMAERYRFIALQAYTYTQEFSRATEYGEKALQAFPYEAAYYKEASASYAQTARLAETAEAFKAQIDLMLDRGSESLQRQPYLSSYYSNVGYNLLEVARPESPIFLEQAIGMFDEAIAREPTKPSFYAFRGVALQNLNRPDEAEAAFLKALALKPDYADGHLMIAEFYLGQNDLEKAREHAHTAWRYDNDNQRAADLLASLATE